MVKALTIARGLATGELKNYEVDYVTINDRSELQDKYNTLSIHGQFASGFYVMTKSAQVAEVIATLSEKWDKDSTPLDFISIDKDINAKFFFALI